MGIARIIKEDFLQQSAYTPYDYTCPLEKTVGMLKSIISYYENAKSLIDNSSEEHKVTLNQIKLHTEDVLIKIINAKMDVLPTTKPKDIRTHFRKLRRDRKRIHKALGLSVNHRLFLCGLTSLRLL